MTDRYDGNGDPVWHEHAYPADFSYDLDATDADDYRYDALAFANGKAGVWSAATKQMVSYQKDRKAALKEAKRLASLAKGHRA